LRGGFRLYGAVLPRLDLCDRALQRVHEVDHRRRLDLLLRLDELHSRELRLEQRAEALPVVAAERGRVEVGAEAVDDLARELELVRRAPALLLDRRLALAMEQPERDVRLPCGRLRRRSESDGDVDQPEADRAVPGRPHSLES